MVIPKLQRADDHIILKNKMYLPLEHFYFLKNNPFSVILQSSSFHSVQLLLLPVDIIVSRQCTESRKRETYNCYEHWCARCFTSNDSSCEFLNTRALLISYYWTALPSFKKKEGRKTTFTFHKNKKIVPENTNNGNDKNAVMILLLVGAAVNSLQKKAL